jgi:meso-butanediol dehydrogenase / (S,S)-butanediol dehydrogenase / diacetyl reductase
MKRFDGRMVFVTGAGHGIGRAIAHRLAREGASIAVADIDFDAAERVAQEVVDIGGSALAVSCDITDRASVDASIVATIERFGGLDVLVNTAGGDWHPTPDERTEEDHWNRVVDLNLTGAMRCVSAALPYLLESTHGGSVVSIGSVNGMAAFGGFPYSAAKAGLENLTKNLAVEYGHQRVRFNLVAPGTIRTRVWDNQPGSLDQLGKIYPLGRVGEPEDIAAAVAFLASDDAAWITGTTLPVDGGIMAGPRSLLFNRNEES